MLLGTHLVILLGSTFLLYSLAHGTRLSSVICSSQPGYTILLKTSLLFSSFKVRSLLYQASKSRSPPLPSLEFFLPHLHFPLYFIEEPNLLLNVWAPDGPLLHPLGLDWDPGFGILRLALFYSIYQG